jgi:hypothetical protein
MKKVQIQTNTKNVVISPNPQKTRERINADGQVINPQTKQAIK